MLFLKGDTVVIVDYKTDSAGNLELELFRHMQNSLNYIKKYCPC